MDPRGLALMALLALAGCSGQEPPEELTPSVSQGEDAAAIPERVASAALPETLVADREACTGECSEEDGYRWAMQQAVANPEACSGPLPFLEGCRRYAFEHEDGHDFSR